MAYFVPYLDETGLHIPTYEDIQTECIDKMKQIFGSDIYIDTDSQDYQQIAIFSKMIYDSYNLALLQYNNRTPLTAVGVGLDNLCALAGITRKPAKKSSVQLVITGTPGTVLHDAFVYDNNKNRWNLPENVKIPDTGQINVTALSEKNGFVAALPDTVNTIGNPTFGWTGVTNTQASVPGTDIETDFELRGRFALSTMSPSYSVFESLLESIKSVSGVSRVSGWENDTGEESTGTEPPNVPAGLPPHSVCFVVEGGKDEAVAQRIYLKKTPGCFTSGTTSVVLESITGNKTEISFYRPEYTDLKVRITIKKLSTYNDTYPDKIVESVVDYINNVNLGETIYNSIIWSVAMDAMDAKTYPAFSVTKVEFSEDNGGSWNQNDFVPRYYGVSITDADNVEVIVSE